MARGQDEFRGSGCGGLQEQHVASGAVEQGCQDLGGGGGTVFAEDALIGDASGDLHSGFAGYVAEDLVEAGVGCGDDELAFAVRHLGRLRGLL